MSNEETLEDSVKSAIRQAYEHNKKTHPDRNFTREVYRGIADELNLDYRSGSTVTTVFGSWAEGVEASIDIPDDIDTVEEFNPDDNTTPLLTRRIVPPDQIYKVLSIPDIHAPYESKAALEAAIRVGEEFKPDEVVQLGDLQDFHGLSHFPKKRDRPSKLEEELERGTEILKEIKERTGAKRAIMLEGNHEARIRKYIWNKAPQLGKLKALNIDNLLRLKEIGWEFIPEHKFYAINDVHFTHGEFCNMYASKKHMDEYRVSIVHGHLHRIESRYHKGLDRTIEGHEMGCLCSFDVSADYVKRANWQHGVGTIVIKGNDHWINCHHIRNGVVEYNGKILST